jgi:hypothetical protein
MLSTDLQSKFALVPFFSVLEKNFKINLQLSAFAQMFTYILYCPDIVECPWLLQMIPMNISRSQLTSLEMPSRVECMALLHSPIIIDMNKLEAVISKDHKNVMEYDVFTQEIMYTQEMSDFFITAEIVTGCIFKMEDNSFFWIYEIELNEQFEKFGDLMNFFWIVQ